jgi:hypothetical protein
MLGASSVESVMAGTDQGGETVLWALVIALYNLEALDEGQLPIDMERMQELLAHFPPETVSRCFLLTSLAFNPPNDLEEAKSRYEQYGVEVTGLEKMYPDKKPS